MAADYVQLPCHECVKAVYPDPLTMTLVVDNGNGIYTFPCPPTCPIGGIQTQEAHPWLVAQLAHAGVPVTDRVDVLADEMAAALANDDDIATEMDGWQT